MKIPYGFTADDTGRVTIDKTHAQAIQMIYREYLNGNSLGGLAKMLVSRHISSPSGNTCWGFWHLQTSPEVVVRFLS